MDKRLKKILCSSLIGLLMVVCMTSPAAAAWDPVGLFQKTISGQILKDVNIPAMWGSANTDYPTDDFKGLDGRMKTQASEQNMERVYRLMNQYDITAVRIQVMDSANVVQRNYYVVRNRGLLQDYPGNVDQTFKISIEEADQILDRVQDGKISFDDEVKIASILHDSSKALEYFKLSYVRLKYAS